MQSEMKGPLDMISEVELKYKYRSRKKVAGRWVYDYGEGGKPRADGKTPKQTKESKQALLMAEDEGFSSKDIADNFTVSEINAALDKAKKEEGQKETISKLNDALARRTGKNKEKDKPSKKELQEATEKVLRLWNNSKRDKAAIDRYNEQMFALRAGINPFEKKSKGE